MEESDVDDATTHFLCSARSTLSSSKGRVAGRKKTKSARMDGAGERASERESEEKVVEARRRTKPAAPYGKDI